MILNSPYRSLLGPLLDCIDTLQKDDGRGTSSAPFTRRAVWLWSRCCHRRAGTNSGRMTVTTPSPSREVVSLLVSRQGGARFTVTLPLLGTTGRMT